MENPLREDGTPTLAFLNRTGVGGPTLGLPAAHVVRISAPALDWAMTWSPLTGLTVVCGRRGTRSWAPGAESH